MSTLKISKHSDVPTALDLVKEEVDKESRRIFSAGGDALKAGNIKPAKEAIAYAEKLSDFVKKIQRLGDEWKKLEAKIEDFRNTRDKKKLEKYIDNHVLYMADLYDTITYLLIDAELTAMETLSAVEEYRQRFGESYDETDVPAAEETDEKAEV